MSPFLSFWIPFFFWSLLASSAMATPDQKGLDFLAFESFQADFVQETRASVAEGGGLVSTIQGYVDLKKPHFFRWRSQGPDEVLIVGDGHFVWQYDRALKQVIKQPYHLALDQSHIKQLLQEAPPGQQAQSVPVKQCGRHKVDRCYWLDKMQCWVGVRSGQMALIKTVDALNQDTEIVFSHVQINQPLAKALFSFKVPKGVEVVSHD